MAANIRHILVNISESMPFQLSQNTLLVYNITPPYIDGTQKIGVWLARGKLKGLHTNECSRRIFDQQDLEDLTFFNNILLSDGVQTSIHNGTIRSGIWENNVYGNTNGSTTGGFTYGKNIGQNPTSPGAGGNGCDTGAIEYQ